MKQKLIIILLLQTACWYSPAQLFKGGVLLGLNACQVDGDNYWGYHKLGLMAGVYVYTPVSNRLDVQIEIKYMGKGAHNTPSDLYPNYYDNTLNYIEIPLILRYNTNTKLSLEGGFGFGYLFAFLQEDENGKLSAQDTSPFKPFELSWIMGLTYQISDKFKVGVRYSYSITPIFDFKDYGTYTYQRFFTAGAYNNLFSTGIYYTIR